MTNGEIEVAPLAFMRGRTLAHAYVILDEAQNTTAVQMKMVLTRMGEGTRMVITGDLTQVDLPAGVRSGLRDALETLEGVPGIGVVRLDKRDVVRHPLVARIVDAYEQREAAAGEQRREAPPRDAPRTRPRPANRRWTLTLVAAPRGGDPDAGQSSLPSRPGAALVPQCRAHRHARGAARAGPRQRALRSC